MKTDEVDRIAEFGVILEGEDGIFDIREDLIKRVD